MRYFKLISGTNIVGVATQFDFVRFQTKHRIVLYCDLVQAQYLQYKDVLYHAEWLLPPSEGVDYHEADIEEIEENEYTILLQSLEINEQIEIETNAQNEIIETEEEIQEEVELTVAFVKKTKIAEMEKECQNYIINGIDVTLSDGKSHHFSLSIQDQLNIAALSAQLQSGVSFIPYHADGELCQYFTNEEMQQIVMCAIAHKTYHISYFNSLKNYISSLRSIEKISNIKYGVEIPEKYQSDVLKDIYKEML